MAVMSKCNASLLTLKHMRQFIDVKLSIQMVTIPYSDIKVEIQSTLVISKLKGPSETVRDIRTSTYQIYSIEEKTI